MFLYSCVLLLLPAMALAQCSEGTSVLFFNIIDADKDGYIEPKEADAFVENADANKDEVVTFEEADDFIPRLAPELAGRIDEVVDFYDVNKDGVITAGDVDYAYKQIDANRDENNSREEFDAYIARVC